MSRLRYNFVGGKVDDNPLSSGATTLTSNGLAAFPTIASPNYVALILDPDAVWGEPEIVWVTAHTVGATTATITRAQEGTVARAHSNDTYWAHGATVEDLRLTDYTQYSPDNQALWTADLGFDYEFNATTTSLPTGWSWVNQGSATYQEQYGGGAISMPVTAGEAWRMLVQNISSASSFLLTAKVVGIATNGPGYTGGLILRESSSGKFVVFSSYSNNGVYVEKWTNPTTYAGSAYGISGQTSFSRVEYFRIRKNSSSSWDFEGSHDGLAWIPWASAINVSSFITPDQFGFGTDGTGSIFAATACHWFRVR